jgi:hypothetical protein
MAEHTSGSSDPLIERTEKAAAAARAANLFDLRRIIGGVFLVWGVVLFILGVTESDAEIEKAGDVNINLWAGLGMLVLSGLFLLWAFTRPLGEELRATGEGEPAGRPGAPAPRGVDASSLASHQRSRGARRDRPGGEGGGDAGGEQGEN